MTPLFKRDDKTTIAELEEYYANQRKSRNPKAWLMAFLSLLITVGVVTSLFFAGRWSYRSITDKNEPIVATIQSDQTTESEEEAVDADLPTFDSEVLGEQGISFEDSTSDNQEDVVVADGSEGTVSDEAATITVEAGSTEDSSDTPVVAGENTDSQNSSDDDDVVTTEGVTTVPNTGADDVMIILLILAIAGYFISRNKQLSSSDK